jgi:hypothetical protein
LLMISLFYYAKKIRILPKQYFLYIYHIGTPGQQISLQSTADHVYDVYVAILNIPYSEIQFINKRIYNKQLKIIFKYIISMFYLAYLGLCLNKNYYFWQKKIYLKHLYKQMKLLKKKKYNILFFVLKTLCRLRTKLSYGIMKIIAVLFPNISIGISKILKHSKY